jgi:hypothetical protein
MPLFTIVLKMPPYERHVSPKGNVTRDLARERGD